MDFDTFCAPLRSAIKAIAYEGADLGLDRIDPAIAEGYVDHDVVAAFWTWQRARDEDADHWHAIYVRLPKADAACIHVGLHQLHPAVLRTLQRATVRHIADWLVRRAKDYLDGDTRGVMSTRRRLRSVAAEVDAPRKQHLGGF